MHSLPRRLIALWILAALLGAGAASARETAVDEFLDEHTGATVSVVHRPLSFALERSHLAAHARDYVSLAAVEVDRSGATQLYLIGYFWSTIDRRQSAAPTHGRAKIIELYADGRPIRLRPDASFPHDLGTGNPALAPPTANAERIAYPLSLDLLRFIATSRSLALRIVADADDEDEERETYALWTDARDSLQSFTRRIASPP